MSSSYQQEAKFYKESAENKHAQLIGKHAELLEARAEVARLSRLVSLAAAFVKANEDFMGPAGTGVSHPDMAEVNRLQGIRLAAYNALRAALAAGSSAKGETT